MQIIGNKERKMEKTLDNRTLGFGHFGEASILPTILTNQNFNFFFFPFTEQCLVYKSRNYMSM